MGATAATMLALALALAAALLVGARALHARFETERRALCELGSRLGRIERALAGLLDTSETLVESSATIATRIGRLDGDLLRRELYRGASPRHADAIEAVRGGATAETIAREHGLSDDEAELLVSLHAQPDPT